MNNSAILFIHGGPGLSSSYFRGWFTDLEKTFDLLFYDQNYDIPNDANAIEFLTSELLKKLHDVVKKYDRVVIFAHSWGVFLVLQAFNKNDATFSFKKIEKIIFSNPSDSNWDEFCNSGDKLFAKMPNEEIDKISKCTNGIELMKLAMPYYVGSTANVPNIEIDRYDMAAYDRISAEMVGYDVTHIIQKLPKDKVYTIYCENDFEQISGSPEFLQYSNVYNFSNAGHFPFAEYPQKYIKLLYDILT